MIRALFNYLINFENVSKAALFQRSKIIENFNINDTEKLKNSFKKWNTMSRLTNPIDNHLFFVIREYKKHTFCIELDDNLDCSKLTETFIKDSISWKHDIISIFQDESLLTDIKNVAAKLKYLNYVKANKKKVTVVFPTRELEINILLKDFMRLFDYRLTRVHKSYAVNFSNIVKQNIILTGRPKKIIVPHNKSTGYVVPVGEEYSRIVKNIKAKMR